MNHRYIPSLEARRSAAVLSREDDDEGAATERTPDRKVEPMKPVGWPELRAFPPDPPAALGEDVSRAENEGMVPVPPPRTYVEARDSGQ